MTRILKFLSGVAVALAAAIAPAQDAVTRVIPIPQQPFAGRVPGFVGTPAVGNPFPALPVPEDPFMAPNGKSNTHVDAYQSDTYPTAGPLGRGSVVSSTFLAAECGTVTFDSRGRIIVVCVGFQPVVHLLDPVTLASLARFPLPSSGSGGTFGAGGIFLPG